MKILQDLEPHVKAQRSKETPDKVHLFPYAIIVPCYNEEKRFPGAEFLKFARNHPEVLLCFVNDGSKDQTLSVLRGVQYQCPQNIYVLSLEKNGGKAEAVRQGMLTMHSRFNVSYLGFLDADMATLPEEWLEMAKINEQNPQFGAVVGSRIQRLGAKIKRNDSRSFISKIVKVIIKKILKASFQDSQCGAKVFKSALVPSLFHNRFHTPWLFDVEIFLRLQDKFGTSTLQNGVLEFPLMHWREVGDSKLRLKDSLRIPFHLMLLFIRYRLLPILNTKTGYLFLDNKIALSPSY